MSWQAMTLGDVVTLKRGHDLPERDRREGQVPIVSSSGVTGFHNVAKAEPPGVVTGRYGTLGEVYFINEPYWPLNTSLYAIDFHENDPKFVSYFLRQVLKGASSNNKAAVPGVNRNDLHALKVKVPNRDIQVRIAGVLTAYDDFIENNQRRIKLLEEAARLIHREWFVRLRFPGQEHVDIENGIPHGWREQAISECVTSQYGHTATATDDRSGPKYLRGTDINKSSFINWDTVPYCPDDGLDLDKYALHVGDILVIRMADPGKVAIIEEDIQAVFASYLVRLKVLPGTNLLPLYLFYAMSGTDYQGFVSGSSAKSTRASASAPLLTSFKIRIPPMSLQSEFVRSVEPLRAQMAILLRQNSKLSAARNLLLPRLMSGEVVV